MFCSPTSLCLVTVGVKRTMVHMPVLNNAAVNFAKAGLSLVPGAGPFTGPAVDLLVDGINAIADIQDQQLTLLTSINENVQRLVDSPWRAAQERIRFAALPGRSDEDRRSLLYEARGKLFDAAAVQPDFSMARAEIQLDLALISASLGDGPGTLYAFAAAVRAAWHAALAVRWVNLGDKWSVLVPADDPGPGGVIASALERIRARSGKLHRPVERDYHGYPITDREIAALQIATQWLELGIGAVEGFADDMAIIARTNHSLNPSTRLDQVLVAA